MTDNIINRPSVEQARERADDLGRYGEDGEIKVAVPKLKDALDRYGKLDFLDNLQDDPSGFTPADRLMVIDQLIRTIDEFYVHRDLKWARHAVDAGRALRSLRRSVNDTMPDLEFHTEVAGIIKKLQDIHTAYVLPSPYRQMIAFLPFTLESCIDEDTGKPRIVVNDLLEDFSKGPFELGAEILTWNGVPIDHAVRNEGILECAANAEAQFSLGVRLMTIRWLGTSLPPKAHWITISYLGLDGKAREIRFSWRILKMSKADGSDMQLPIQALGKVQHLSQLEQNVGTTDSLTDAMDPRSEIEGAAQYVLFGSGADRADPEQETALHDDQERPVARTLSKEPINDGKPEYFRATVREAKLGDQTIKFGHLRIYGFNMISVSSFVKRFRRILRQLPQDYLIIDIRSNPGGNLNIAECLMQLFTPRRVEPLPFQFRATREVERLVDNDGQEPMDDLQPWIERVEKAVTNGQQYSLRGPLTEEYKANLLGQEYYGTVGLLIDGITYSSGDIFAAHFADLEIGPIYGTDKQTGGGGGNMIYQKRVSAFAPNGLGVVSLPKDAHMHFAIRRYKRNGAGEGETVEEYGIQAGKVFKPTLDDLRNNNRRLLWQVLEDMVASHQRRPFGAEVILGEPGDPLKLKIQTSFGEDIKPLLIYAYADDQPLAGDFRNTDDKGQAVVVAKWNRKAPIHLRVEAYELEKGAYDIDRRGKLIALFDKTIRDDGSFDEGIFN